jgi:hypothetical protein
MASCRLKKTGGISNAVPVEEPVVEVWTALGFRRPQAFYRIVSPALSAFHPFNFEKHRTETVSTAGD